MPDLSVPRIAATHAAPCANTSGTGLGLSGTVPITARAIPFAQPSSSPYVSGELRVGDRETGAMGLDLLGKARAERLLDRLGGERGELRGRARVLTCASSPRVIGAHAQLKHTSTRAALAGAAERPVSPSEGGF